ncbi:MAG: nitroreductase/quinone reductase family protein [Actinomycetota bacterium]|nr:nitroreductase/quinone reductase family protein [Actinomycetota bacterium]
MSDQQPTSHSAAPTARYIRPTSPAGRVFDRLGNGSVAALTRMGISLYGSRVLYVRGRSSGQWRSNPVNPLTIGGHRYLVAPRGHTQWVRNLRAAGAGELRRGRRAERFTAVEVPDERKPEILRAYLRKWKFEVGTFFDGVGPDASDARLAEIAPGYPVFEITPA